VEGLALGFVETFVFSDEELEVFIRMLDFLDFVIAVDEVTAKAVLVV